MMLYFKYIMTFLFLTLLSSVTHAIDSQLSEVERLRGFIHNGIEAVFEKDSDWKTANNLTASYIINDPIPSVTNLVETQVTTINTYFRHLFLGSKTADNELFIDELQEAIKPLLSQYFDYQCLNLYEHFLNYPKPTSPYWHSNPTEYTTTLVYERAANKRGVFLEQYYHRLYNLGSHNCSRVQLIETENDKYRPSQHVIPLPPSIPPPVFTPSTGIKIRKNLNTENAHRRFQTMASESFIKELTKPVPIDMLAQIKRGIHLKNVTVSSFQKPKPTNPHMLELEMAFKRIRPDIEGNDGH